MDSTRHDAVGDWSGRIDGRRSPTSRSSGCTGPRTVRGACARSVRRRRRAPDGRCRRSSSSGRRSTGTTAARTSSASSARNGDRWVSGQAVARRDRRRRRRCSAPTPTRRIHHLAGDDARGALGARAAPFAGRDAAAAAPRRRRGAHRARTVAHVPDARPRLHASASGATVTGTASWPSVPRNTRSRSSTTSSRGTSTCNK